MTRPTFLSKALSALACSLALSSAALAQTYVVHVPINASQLRNTPVQMGNIVVGTTSSSTATFQNAASNTVKPVVTPAAGVTISQDGCTNVTLAPGQFCSFGISVRPTVAGAYSNAVTITAPEDPLPWLYNISATAVQLASTLQAVPSLHSFGNYKIGEASPPKQIRITNTGADVVEFSGLSMSGNASSLVIEGTDCDAQLDPGQFCDVDISFQPIYFGWLSSKLMIQTVGATNQSIALSSVSGTGVQGIPEWSVAQLSFNNVPVGSTAPSQTAILKNVGDAVLGITDLSLQGDSAFNLVSTTCGDTLNVGSTCQVVVDVTPTDSVLRSASISLSSDSRSTPLSRVQLYVRPLVDKALLTVTPTSIDFGSVINGQSSTQTFTVKSTGTLAVAVSGYALSGANAGDFNIINAASCTGSLPPGQECTLQVSATPSAAGARVGTIAITSTSADPVSSVNLSATGVVGNLQASPATLAFGSVETAQTSTLTGTLTNIGNAPATISGMALSGANSSSYALLNNTCATATLAPAASCTYSVKFSPTVAGALAANVLVVNNGQTSPVSIALSGTGTLPAAPQMTLTAQACTPSGATAGVLISCSAVLQNTGTVAGTVGTASIVGSGYSVPTSNCAASLAPGQSCVITTTISSIGAGTPSGTLSVPTGAGTKSVAINPGAAGPAPAAAGTVSLGSDCGVSVNLGRTAACTLTIQSTGLLPLTVTDYVVSRGGQSATFTAPGSCANLAAGNSCLITLQSQLSNANYAPCGTTACAVLNYAAAGSYASAVALNTTAGNKSATATFVINPLTLSVSGNGTLKTGLSGYVDTNFTITNNSAVPVTFNSSTLASITGTAGQFIVNGGTCVSGNPTLGFGQSCTVTVGCNGSASPATLTGSLNFASSALSVSANGAGGGMYTSPTSLASQALSCQVVAGNLDITSTYPGWTTVVPTNTQSGNWRRATNSSLSNMTITARNAGTDLLVYTDSNDSTHCNIGKVLAPGAYCDFLEIVTKTNSNGTPVVVAPSNSFIGTSQGNFAYSPSYSVAALALTSAADNVPLQWGSTRDVTITVQNISSGMASDIALVPSSKTVVKSNGCSNVQPNATCQIVVTLTPDVASAANAGVTTFVSSLTVNGRFESVLNNVRSPASGSVVTIGQWTQTWNTAAPTLNLVANSCTPASATAGVLITCTATLSNTGQGSVTLGSMSISGSGYSMPTTTCGSTLAAGANCQFTTTVTSVGSGTPSGTLSVNSAVGVKSVTITPNAAGPAPSPSGTVATGADCNTAADFGKTATCTLTISSVGNLPLHVTGYTVTRGSYVANLSAPPACATVAVGGSCQIVLQSQLATTGYAPCSTTACNALNYSQAGTVSTDVNIATDAGAKTATASFTIRPVSLSVSGNGTVVTGVSSTINTTFTVLNGGQVPVNLTAASFASVTGAQFSLNGGTCLSANSTLASGQSCTVIVKCTTPVTVGNYSGSLNFAASATSVAADGAGGASFSGVASIPAQSLSCQSQPAQLTISSAFPGWTNVIPTNSQSGNWRRVTNTGLSNVTVSAINAGTGLLSYTDSANTGHCNVGKALAPNAYCDFMEIVSTTNTTATPLTVAPANSYINTAQGAFPYSPNYSVAALTATSAPDANVLQWGEPRDVVVNVVNNTPGAASSIALATSAGSTVKSTTCLTLAAGASCTVTITVTPPANANVTSYGSNLTIQGKFERVVNGVAYPPTGAAAVIGTWAQAWTSAAPQLTLTMGTHPSTAVGTVSTATHRVKNTGTGAVPIVATIPLAQFTVSTSACPAKLAPGAECDITTSITPSASGATYADTLVLTYFGKTTVGNLTMTTMLSPVMSVTGGNSAAFYLGMDNVLYGLGQNAFGELGDGTSKQTVTYKQLLTNVKQISGGRQGQASLVLRQDGTIYGTGYGLAYAGAAFAYSWVQSIPAKTNIVKVEAGGQNTGLYLDSSGVLWAQGTWSGALRENKALPHNQTVERVASNVADMSASVESFMILKKDGTLWTAGANGWGQLGVGNMTAQGDSTSATFFQVMSDVKQISAGEATSIVLKNDGTVWAVGEGVTPSVPNTLFPQYRYSTRFVKIADNGVEVAAIARTAVGKNVVFRTADGKVWGYGNVQPGYNPGPTLLETGITSIGYCYGTKADNTIWSFCSTPSTKLR